MMVITRIIRFKHYEAKVWWSITGPWIAADHSRATQTRLHHQLTFLTMNKLALIVQKWTKNAMDYITIQDQGAGM